jgi:hypothetical protein
MLDQGGGKQATACGAAAFFNKVKVMVNKSIYVPPQFSIEIVAAHL